MLSRLRHPIRALIVAAVLIVAAAIVFGVLTQTQLGRDQVARQMEVFFGDEFRGTIEIERLSGNLLRTFYGGPIELRDERGRTVVRADSVILEPRWRSLLRNRLELRRVTLVGGELDLVYEDGRWNVAEALSPRDTLRAPSERALGVLLPQILLVDVDVRTSNSGPLPDAVVNGSIFDFTNTALLGADARLALDVRDGRTRIRVGHLEGFSSLTNGAVRLSGLLDVDQGDIRHADVNLRLTDSHIRANYQKDSRERVSLNVAQSHLAAGELRLLIPNYPLYEDLSLGAVLRGTTDELNIRRATVRHDDAYFSLSGTLFPRDRSTRFEVVANVSGVDAPRVASLVGEEPGEWPLLHSIGGSVSARGELELGPTVSLVANLTPEVSTSAGSVRGTASVEIVEGRLHHVGGDLAVSGLDPSAVFGDWPSGLISGRMTLDGHLGNGLPAGRAVLDLSESIIEGRVLSGLSGEVISEPGVVRGRLQASGDGILTMAGFVEPENGRYDLALGLVDLNLHALHPDAPVTRLTGRAVGSASGHSIDGARADITMQLDNSTAHVADSTWHLPEDELRAIFRPADSDEPRLTLDTDAVSIVFGGEFGWEDLIASVMFWGDRLVDAVRRDFLPDNGDTLAVAREIGELRHAEAQRLTIDVTSHQDHALSPWVAGLAPGSSVRLEADLGTDAFEALLRVEADQLTVGAVHLDGAGTSLEVTAAHDDDLLNRLGLEVLVHADSIRLGDGRAFDTRIEAAMPAGSRTLALDVDARRPDDSIHVDLRAAVALLGDRYRVTGNVDLDAGEDRWIAREMAIEFHPDRVVFNEFDARRILPDNGHTPHIGLRGVAGAAPTDTLLVSATAIALEEIFDLLSLTLPFDGQADADLLVTSVTRSPAILGSAVVEDLYIWGDLAGRLEARSEIIAGEDGFFADLRVMPHDDVDIHNDIRLFGNVRFPGRHDDGSRDPGRLDLSARLDRLDLFIFNHLFPDIVAESTGGGVGNGSITGDWSYPIFNADLTIVDGETTVPAFNLGLGAQGRVTVDREGIHLRRVALQDKVGGRAAVNGSILFNEYRFFSFDLHGDLSAFEVIDVTRAQAGTLPFYGHIRADGTATLTGPLHDAYLRSADAVTTPDSRIYIPVQATGPTADAGFLLFGDEFGHIPETTERASLIAERPETERPFLDALQMTLNVDAPSGSTVHLVFDPIIGDVITAVGSGQMQLIIREAEFLTFGTFEVERGDYLFTAGDVFTRRFDLEDGGTLVWEGDPIDARLDLPATYRTRASLAGLGLTGVNERQRVPFLVNLHVSGQVTGPLVDLSLELDETGSRAIPAAEALRLRLNEPDRQAEYATSVLLTNTFLLAPSERPGTFTDAADDLLFASLSELVSTRLNLFLNQALGADNLDVAVGVQQRAGLQDLDLTYGVAVRLLDERLVIRGEGVYQQLEDRPLSEALHGEVVVEVRVSDGVSLEFFYRREGDLLLSSGVAGITTGSYGAGVNYQAEFTNWSSLLRGILSLEPDLEEAAEPTASTRP